MSSGLVFISLMFLEYSLVISTLLSLVITLAEVKISIVDLWKCNSEFAQALHHLVSGPPRDRALSLASQFIHTYISSKSRCNRPEYTPAGLYPGSKRPRLDYTRVYYSLGQFTPRGILWPRPIQTPSGQIIPLMIAITISIVLGDIAVPKNYSIFQQVTEDSVLSGKLSEKAKLTELKS